MLKQKVSTSNLVPLTDEIRNSPDFNEELVIDNYYEKESSIVVRFRYTLAAIRNYNLKYGRDFWKDYKDASDAFADIISSGNLSESDLKNMSQEQQLKLIGLVTNPVIMNFIRELIPCLYVEVHDGQFIQNEATIDIAENSEWLMELVSIEFFAEVFGEITANMGSESSKKMALQIAK